MVQTGKHEDEQDARQQRGPSLSLYWCLSHKKSIYNGNAEIYFFFLKSSNTMKRLNMTQQRKQFFFTVWTANKHPSAGKKGWDAVSLLLGGICWFQVALQ